MKKDNDVSLVTIRNLTEQLRIATTERDELSRTEVDMQSKIRRAILKGENDKAAELQVDLNNVQVKLQDYGRAIESGEANLRRLKAAYAEQRAAELRNGPLKDVAEELGREIDKVFADLTTFVAGYDRLIHLANRCGSLFAEYENVFSVNDAPYEPLSFRVVARDRFGVRDEVRRLLMGLPGEQQSTWGKILRDLAR